MKLNLPDALTAAIKWFLTNLHTAMPAIITEFDKEKQIATVQPTIKRTLTDGKVQILPLIYNVPVITLKTDHAGLHIPVKKGDGVLLIFCERALERWLSSDQGDIVEAGDTRQYNITDAIAILGLNPKTFDYPYKDDSVYLYNEKARIKITPENKIAIKNEDLELLEFLDRLILNISAITVSGVPIDNLAVFTAMQTELLLLREVV